MYSKLKVFVLSLFVLNSLFSYKVDNVKADSWDVAPATVPVAFYPTLTKAIPFIGANVAHAVGQKGSGAAIVIIDTGIEKSHPFFQSRVVLEACFATKCPNGQPSMVGSGAAAPVHWHGTHVAGIAAGSSQSMSGVASEASIIAVNVFDPSGSTYDSNIIKALQWVATIADKYNVAAVNMSLGSRQSFKTTCDDYLPDMTSAIKNLKDLNVATVISSGNSYANGMSSPACISYAVSVAATLVDSDYVTDFSNISNLTTIAAPGNNINSSKLLGSYGSASGTSMASPFVTGAFALYRSSHGKRSVDEVINIFKSNAKIAKDTYTGITIPRLDLTSIYSGQPVVPTTTTTTTTVSSTTTLPIPSTTTTIPFITTTTIKQPPVSSTTTIPSRIYIPNPILLEVNGLPKSYVWIKYKDPYMNKSFISYYELTCNGINKYTIPFEQMYSLHSYKLEVPASQIDYCYLQAVLINGGKTYPTTVRYIYPKNRNTSSVTNTFKYNKKQTKRSKSN